MYLVVRVLPSRVDIHVLGCPGTGALRLSNAVDFCSIVAAIKAIMYHCSAGPVASSDVCSVRGCQGVALIAKGVYPRFGDINEPGHACGEF